MYRVFNCLTVEHDLRLVLLAGALCFLASVTAVNLLYRAGAAEGRSRTIWILTAGVASGCGIWATHFVAMLAYQPDVPTAYNIGLTVMSLVAAVAITSFGLGFAVLAPLRWSAPIGGGIVGGGVACMHYLGMSALELPGQVVWSMDLVLVSVLLGVVLAAGALTVAVRRRGIHTTLAGAVLLTLAIVSHHFTAMGAILILPDPTRVIAEMSIAETTLALAVTIVTIAILALSMICTIVDERFHNQSRRLDAALNNMRQGLLLFDAQGQLVLLNKRYLEIYALPPDTKPDCTLRELLERRKAAGTFIGDPEQHIANLIEESKVEHTVVELPDGRSIAIRNHPVDGGGWVSTYSDITVARRAERELRRTKTFLDTILDNVPATLVVKDVEEHRYLLINRAGESLFGMPRAAMIGKNAHDFFSKDVADIIEARDQEVLRSGGLLLVENNPVMTPDGSQRLVTTKRLAVLDEEGKPQYLLAVIEDVTERRRAEAQIEHMARHDSLTDLPNRATFNEHLKSALAQAAKTGERLALLCIDLDRFKEVNDVFGHAVGDALLVEVSKRLQAAAGEGFLSRLGGDEFIVVLSEGPQPSTAESASERLLATVADDLVIEGQHLRIGLSIGVAIYPSDGADEQTLVGNADAALYRAKAQGRGRTCFFEADMDQRLRERRALQHDLQSAVLHGELTLHYQPQATLGGEVVGFEALVRWNHPTRGLLLPGAFIPLAEENGLILSMGEWILREACREASTWPRPLHIAVNLSPIQFRHGDLPGLVHMVLLETGLNPRRLELEITEGVLIGDFSRAVSILRRLKALGVRIAMDDFGTGYSSLSYLQSFPFDKIKIDQTFISNVDRNPQSAAIVRAVIGLARGLDLPVIAEGVETSDQLAFLTQEACNEVQGYLVGRPLSISNYDAAVGRSAKPSAKQELRLAV
ncbi:MAG: hypothetical protein QOI12_3968 [Alphaproteobacteria bacterium]|nr:hypothetical protein [Alphaproteobacteria bacterium]